MPAGEVNQGLRHGLAGRMPRLVKRNSGEMVIRAAERATEASLVQPPPRCTRMREAEGDRSPSPGPGLTP